MAHRHRRGLLTLCAALAALAVLPGEAAVREGALVRAVKQHDATQRRQLLAKRVDVNAREADGSTALHWAVYKDDAAAVGDLLRAGASPDLANDLGVTPLLIATEQRGTAVAALLLAHGANPNLAPRAGGTPLMVAIRTGDAATVQALLARGADPNIAEAANGQTALMWAVAQNNPDTVKLLLKAGANLHAPSRVVKRIVALCCGGGTTAGGDEEGGNGSTEINQGGFTPLLFAAHRGLPQVAQVLLEAGASPNDVSGSGASALALAAFGGWIDSQSLAVAVAGNSVSFVIPGRIPAEGHTDVAEALLRAGADPNAMAAGYAPLHAAVLRGDERLVKALLAGGANPNATLQQGTMIKRLQRVPAYAFDKALLGATPYLLAARAANVSLMRLLAAAGANPQLALADGRTPLMVAFQRQTSGMIGVRVTEPMALAAAKTAVALGADVNAVDEKGNHPLHLAVMNKSDTVVRFLAEAGARLHDRNTAGQTALDLAKAPPPPLVTAGGDERAQKYKADYAKWKETGGWSPTALLLKELGATE